MYPENPFPVPRLFANPLVDYELLVRRCYGETKPDDPLHFDILPQWVRMTEYQQWEYTNAYKAVKTCKEQAATLAKDGHVCEEVVQRQLGEENEDPPDWKLTLENWRKAAHCYRQLSYELETLVMNLDSFKPFVERYHADGRVKAYLALERDYYVNQALAYGGKARNFAQQYNFPNKLKREDGTYKIPEVALPVHKLAGFRKERFKHNELYRLADDGWEGAWSVGRGAYGTVGLWVKSEDGRIADRIACKNVVLPRLLWLNETAWNGHIGDPNRRPNEIVCHQLLSGSDLVPRLLYAHVDEIHREYIMYLEYCPSGDLDGIKSTYLGFNVERESPLPIPVPFLWRTFLSLAQVGFVMQYGHNRFHDEQAVEGWIPIVHRDMKPNNVFLGLPPSEREDFSLYPTPLLGDFGVAIRTKKDDTCNPNYFSDVCCTFGYVSPEQRAFVDLATMEPIERYPLTAQTNVWGIGRIMYGLAGLEHRIRQPQYLGEIDSQGLDLYEPSPDLGIDPIGQCGWELASLINACTSQKPDDRPTFSQLIRAIQEAINSSAETEEMRTANDVVGTVDYTDSRRLLGGLDSYKIGFSMTALPTRQ